MKIKVGFVFSLVLLAILVLALTVALGYPFKAAIFPVITISVALIFLAGLVLPQEIRVQRQDAEPKDKKVAKVRYAAVITWLIVTVVMLWFLGFLATAFLLPFLYLKLSGEKWPLSLGLPLASLFFFYVVFSVVLESPLYEGYLYSLIFG